MKPTKKTNDCEKHKAAEQKSGNAKMEMIEGKMHGKGRGARGKNYKGKAC